MVMMMAHSVSVINGSNCALKKDQGGGDSIVCQLAPAMLVSYMGTNSSPGCSTLIQFSANTPWKDSSLWVLPPTLEMQKKPLALACPSPSHCRYLESQLIHGRPLFLSPCVCV